MNNNSRDQNRQQATPAPDARVVLLDAEEAHGGLAAALRTYGFRVDYVSPGSLRAASQKADVFAEADVLLIDAPYARDLIQQLHEQATQRHVVATPVLALVAGAESPVEALGSVDTMRKPVVVDELIARLRWMVQQSRRERQSATQPLESSGLTLDRDRRRVLHGDDIITLTRKEFAILSWLIRKEGHAVPRSELFEVIGAQARSNTIDVHVKNIRQKLDRLHPGLSSRIQSVRGVGYRIQPTDEPPAWASPVSGERSEASAGAQYRRRYRRSAAPRSRRGRDTESSKKKDESRRETGAARK